MDERDTVLITGSAGLIGTALRRALARDYRVVGMDHVRPREAVEGTYWLRCDLTDDAGVSSALEELRVSFGSRVASVLHLAAYYDFSGKPSPLYRKVTVEGTRRLLAGLRQGGFRAEQFVFSSTLLAMRPVEDPSQVLVESSPTEAEWDYPRSKLATERLLKAERGDIPAVILRIAGVYDDQCRSLPLSRHIQRIYEKRLESYFFPGNADRGQPFVHLDDLVACFRRAIERRRELDPWEVFLIAEEDLLSYRELQERIGRLVHGKEWPTLRIPKPVAKAGAWVRERVLGEDTFIKPWMIDLADDHYPVETRRARERLGWEPRRSLRDSLPRMVESLRRDPRAFYERHGLPLESLPEAVLHGEGRGRR